MFMMTFHSTDSIVLGMVPSCTVTTVPFCAVVSNAHDTNHDHILDVTHLNHRFVSSHVQYGEPVRIYTAGASRLPLNIWVLDPAWDNGKCHLFFFFFNMKFVKLTRHLTTVEIVVSYSFSLRLK